MGQLSGLVTGWDAPTDAEKSLEWDTPADPKEVSETKQKNQEVVVFFDRDKRHGIFSSFWWRQDD